MNTNTEQQLIEKWHNLPLDKQQLIAKKSKLACTSPKSTQKTVMS